MQTGCGRSTGSPLCSASLKNTMLGNDYMLKNIICSTRSCNMSSNQTQIRHLKLTFFIKEVQIWHLKLTSLSLKTSAQIAFYGLICQLELSRNVAVSLSDPHLFLGNWVLLLCSWCLEIQLYCVLLRCPIPPFPIYSSRTPICPGDVGNVTCPQPPHNLPPVSLLQWSTSHQ